VAGPYVLLVWVTHLVACTDRGLFKSHDSAATWSVAQSTGRPPLPSGGVNTAWNDLVLHAPSNTLYMTLATQVAGPDANHWIDIDSWSGGLYKSAGFGPTWSPAWTSLRGSEDARPGRRGSPVRAGRAATHTWRAASARRHARAVAATTSASISRGSTG
jgi:hypothetical protein